MAAEHGRGYALDGCALGRERGAWTWARQARSTGAARPRKPVHDHPGRAGSVLPVAASNTNRDRHAPVAQGIEQRPPEPCAQVRILPGAPWNRCPKTPSPAETLGAGSSRMRRRVRPGAAVCRGLWTRRGTGPWSIAAGEHAKTEPGRGLIGQNLGRCHGRHAKRTPHKVHRRLTLRRLTA